MNFLKIRLWYTESLCVLLYAALLFNGTAFGQRMTSKQTVSDVLIVASGDANFAEFVERTGESTSVSQLGPAGDYLVGITNVGQRLIVGIRIKFDITGADRMPVQVLALEGVETAPGSRRLTGPAPLAQAAAAISTHQFAAYLAHHSIPNVQFFVGKTVSATVDSVTYSDGGFAGPDTLSLFERYAARDQAMQKFYNLMQQSGGSESALKQYLEGAFESGRAAQKKEHGLEDIDFSASGQIIAALAGLKLFAASGHAAATEWASDNARKLAARPHLRRE